MSAGGSPGADAERLARHLTLLSESVRDFAATTSAPDLLLRHIVARIAQGVGDACSLFLLEEDGRTLTLAAREHVSDPGYAASARPYSRLDVRAIPALARALETGAAVLLPRVTPEVMARDLGTNQGDAIPRLRIHSLMFAPLVASGRSLGMLLLIRNLPDSPPLDELDRRLAQNLADHAAQALANARAFEDERRAREALGEAEHVLFEQSPMPMVALDAERLTPIAANEAALALYGYSREEFMKLPVEALRPDGDRAGAETVRDTLLGQPGPVFRGVTQNRRKDGRLIAVEYVSRRGNFRGRPAIISAVIDVTDRQRVSQAQARLAAVIDSSEDAILTMSLDGTIQSWNRGAERVYGHPAAQMIGRSILAMLSPAERREEEAILRRVAAGQRVEPFETRRTRADGTAIDVSIAISPLYDGAGAVIGASKVTRDISDRRRIEEQQARIGMLDAENQRIQEAARLKNQFVAHMSHELRTPMNAILGFAELLHEGKAGPLSAEQREYLGDVLTAARHLLQLINDLLDLAKIESGRLDLRPEPVDVERTVCEVRDTLRGLAAHKQIDLAVEIAPGVGRPVTDPDKLKQVLYNYLSNALKFTGERGRVTTRVRPAAGGRFRIEVQDTGIGIERRDRRRLFVAFQQLDSGLAKRFPGTGLGLALTKKIVEAQGGRVGVRSRPGRGSTFFAVLPLTPAAPPAA
jgi:PAS domain S-box-containing protein